MTAATFQPDLFTTYARSSEEWRKHAERLVDEFAATDLPFSADDLRDAGLEEPEHPNQWGGMFQTFARQGVIRPDGFAISRKSTRRGSVLRMWIGTGKGDDRI